MSLYFSTNSSINSSQKISGATKESKEYSWKKKKESLSNSKLLNMEILPIQKTFFGLLFLTPKFLVPPYQTKITSQTKSQTKQMQLPKYDLYGPAHAILYNLACELMRAGLDGLT